MPQDPNKLSQFWRELKRRRVVHVIAVYASASFIIIELVNNLTEPLNLPSNLATIVIIVLAVGFPLAVILSWIYDLTGEGIEKTRPFDEIPEKQATRIPNAWKIATYISFVVIIGLVTFNIVGSTKGLKEGDIKSLVILPFENYTGDDQLDYVAEGLHASLIGDVGKIGSLRVISQTTASVYKNMEISLPQIAQEADAEAIIEPTVMCYGDSVCIQIRVMSMYPKEKQLWVAEYKEDKSQILNLYSRITKQIADEIMVELTPEEEGLFAKSRTVDREAYDDYLRGIQLWGDMSPESVLKARDYLNSAIERDPDWAPLYSAMATVWGVLGAMGIKPQEIAFHKVYENNNKAIELDPDLAEAHASIARYAMAAEWDWEKAEREYLKALANNPNLVGAHLHYSWLLYSLQRPEEAKIQADLAYKLDPLSPLIQCGYAVALVKGGDCNSALSVLENVLVSNPDFHYAYQIMEAAAFRCGDLSRVFDAAKQILPNLYSLEEETMNEFEKTYFEKGFNAAFEELIPQLEVLAEKGNVPPLEMAYRYYLINQDDKAMEWVEKAVEVHDVNLWELTTYTYNFTRLYDNPRFIEVVEKMNLPLPSK